MRTVKSCLNERFFGYENERLLRGKRKAFCKWKLLFCGKGKLFQLMQSNPIKKSFFQRTATPTSTATKLTCSSKFYPRQPTVSLQYNNPFSKNNSLASALQPPFRTDSKPLRRRFAGKTGFETSRRKALQNLFRQSFESSPESRGSQTSGVLFGSFCTTQKARKTFPSQEAPRFCKPQTSTPQPQLRTATIKTFLSKIRGSANLESAHTDNKLAQTKLNPFAALSGFLLLFVKYKNQ